MNILNKYTYLFLGLLAISGIVILVFLPNLETEEFSQDVIDDIIKVSNEDAFSTAQSLAEKDGILGGISTGANVWAAMQLAKRPDMTGKTIVTIACSFGERYLSTPLAEKAREEMATATAT